jgi:hypothetical protein
MASESYRKDAVDSIKLELAFSLVEIGRTHGMQLTICSQSTYSRANGVQRSKMYRCSKNAQNFRINDFPAKLKGNREDCGCYESKDIGDYDTCPQGCVYCYAGLNWELV